MIAGIGDLISFFFLPAWTSQCPKLQHFQATASTLGYVGFAVTSKVKVGKWVAYVKCSV